MFSQFKNIKNRLFHRERMKKSLVWLAGVVLIFALGFAIRQYSQMNRAQTYSVLSQNKLDEHWNVANVFYVSPMELLDMMASSEEFLLVDIRDVQSYKNEHIKGAVNVPVKKGEISKDVIKMFKDVGKDKQVVIYGENQYSEMPEYLAGELNKKNVRVSVLKIGWNEFRNFPTFWLPESQWGTFDLTEYVE